MKATHTDYMHPRHLRVETGERHPAWNIGQGSFERTSLCLSPSDSQYARLNRPGLPKWTGDDIIDGVAVPRKGGSGDA